MVIGAFLIAEVLTEIGLLQRVACLIVLKTGGTFQGLIIGITLAGFATTIMTCGNSFILMAALCLGICKTLNLERGKTTAAIFLAVIVGSVSSRIYLYNPIMLSVLNGAAKQVLGADFAITWNMQMGHLWPFVFSAVLCVIFLCIFYKPEKPLNGKEYFQSILDQMGPMSIAEKKSLVILAFMFAFIVSSPLHGISADWAYIIIPWFCFLPGINIGTPEGSIKNIKFDSVFFITACFSIGTVASALGIGNIVSTFATPLLAGNSVVFSSALILALTTILNFLMTPLAIFATITMPLAQIAIDLGVNPLPFLYSIFVGGDILILPYEYVPYLIIYGFGMMSMSEFVKLNAIRCLAMIVCFFILVIPYWMFIGLL